ncbi:MAG: hypothetical protein EPN21_16645 [Methylococcaceae bacterium]|nr:MAG: hypothetical protein EPN21_16645 [Methylococcaceae bacterium]
MTNQYLRQHFNNLILKEFSETQPNFFPKNRAMHPVIVSFHTPVKNGMRDDRFSPFQPRKIGYPVAPKTAERFKYER